MRASGARGEWEVPGDSGLAGDLPGMQAEGAECVSIQWRGQKAMGRTKWKCACGYGGRALAGSDRG